MDEERAVENMDGMNEKKIKHESKKDKKKKESKREQEPRSSEKEDAADMERGHEKRKEKKKNKGKKDALSDNEKGSREGESTDVNGEVKRKKRDKNKDKNEKFENTSTEVEGNESKILVVEGESVSRKETGKDANEERKKRKLKTSHEDGQVGEKDGEVIETHGENCKIDATVMVEKKKKEKDKKRSIEGDANEPHYTYSEDGKGDGNATDEPERKKKKKPKKKKGYEVQDYADNGCNDLDKIQNGEIENANKKKKRKIKSVENGSEDRQDNEIERTNNGKSNKKVRFSGRDEIFTLPDCSTEEGNVEEDNLVRGKRFTSEENETLRQAVLKYIEEHELGDEGLEMVLNCSKHPNVKGCWKEIGSAIPYRPYIAIYNRARILFMRSENRKWTPEELDTVLKYHEEHGNNWKPLADEMGKHTWHVKDAYRRIKLPNLKKGNWSQTEYQKLFDLVNTDLQLKVSEEKKSKHGMLRDNICWSAISDELSTRNQAICCMKWYKQLTSPMVAEGVWADSDDYRLLTALYNLDATCVEDVDWDDLVENRSGDVCRKRWNQMVLHIGHHGRKSFAERVEILAQRYCPNLLEAREIWDSKPRVP